LRIKKVIVKGDRFVLAVLSDIHFGHVNCDLNILRNVVNHIRHNKCVWIGGGDYGDAIIPGDPRFDYDTVNLQYKSPQDQYAYIQETFQPIAGKCLGLLDGNHDIIHWKKHVHNYVLEMAKNLGVTYLTIDAYLRFYFEKFNVNFDVYMHHGWTAARTKGAKINRIYDLANIFPYANLYLMGHVHQLGIADKKASLYVDSKLEIRDHLQWFVFAGSFLRGYVKDQTSYIEEKTYPPTLLGSPILTVAPRKGKETVSFDIDYKEVR
jgi:hypothetical protein